MFLEKGEDRGPVHSLHRLGLTPPTPFLQNAVKHSPGRGWGLARQPYCHTISCHSFLFPLGGNAARFFHFVFFVSGPASFAVFVVLLFLGSFFLKNFRERTFVFGWLCWSCVFWWVFAIVFALFFGVSLPKLFGKILLMSGLVFSGFVLSPP